MWEDLEIIIKTKATDSPSKPKTPSSVSRFLPLSINQPLLLTQNCHPWKNNWAPPLNASLTYLLIQIEPMFHISCGLNFLPFLVPLTKHYHLMWGLLPSFSRLTTFFFTSHFMLYAFLYPTATGTNMTKPAQTVCL